VAAPKPNDVMMATRTYYSDYDGLSLVEAGKTHAHAGHPIVNANPEYWVPVSDGVRFSIETATSPPDDEGDGSPPIKVPPVPKPVEP
jgi:hypothetical protein